MSRPKPTKSRPPGTTLNSKGEIIKRVHVIIHRKATLDTTPMKAAETEDGKLKQLNLSIKTIMDQMGYWATQHSSAQTKEQKEKYESIYQDLSEQLKKLTQMAGFLLHN